MFKHPTQNKLAVVRLDAQTNILVLEVIITEQCRASSNLSFKFSSSPLLLSCGILFVFSCSFLVDYTEQVHSKLLTLLAIMLEFGALVWYVEICCMSHCVSFIWVDYESRGLHWFHGTKQYLSNDLKAVFDVLFFWSLNIGSQNDYQGGKKKKQWIFFFLPFIILTSRTLLLSYIWKTTRLRLFQQFLYPKHLTWLLLNVSCQTLCSIVSICIPTSFMWLTGIAWATYLLQGLWFQRSW